MATNFNENSIVSSGGFKPSSKDTPLDIRTRVETEQDIYEIPNPYIGMIVYVKDTGKRFEILTLKEVDTGLTTKNVVDTYKQFTVDLEEYAKIEDVPTKVSELENDKGYLVNQDISGKANVEDVPTKVSELENDRGYATERFVNSEIETINNTINSNINTINSEIDGIDSNIANLNTEIDNINTDLIGVSESIEGSWISVDTKDGYLKDVEILGNTIQNQDNLADIRSVGDKLENQELYEIPVLITGKNLFNTEFESGSIDSTSGGKVNNPSYVRTKDFIKVNENTNYVCVVSQGVCTIYFYDDKYKYISLKQSNNFTTLENCKYIMIRCSASISGDNFQLEEGTVATPYEPYVEDKITILSPVQLEKVGDIADRIICKDGVWGVDKNVIDLDLDTINYVGVSGELENTILIGIHLKDNVILKRMSDCTDIICNLYLGKKNYTLDEEGLFIAAQTENIVYFRINKSKLNNDFSASNTKKYILDNISVLKVNAKTPTFIPLPYDQQIKLRTFANKTNISFGCEIEPTIKASVPKSIGATVSSYSEQIDNLSKELEKINNLEESTASTVTTESDFTTVENTSNGYFEDVKIEGKTLVNMLKPISYMLSVGGFTEEDYTLSNSRNYLKYVKINTNKTPTWIYVSCGKLPFDMLKPNTKYTIKLDKYVGVTSVVFKRGDGTKKISDIGVIDANGCAVVTTTSELVDEGQVLYLNLKSYTVSEVEVSNVIILEGDHTQNPPEFFEGIKSVGQDVDDITITTTNAPMFFGKGGKK